MKKVFVGLFIFVASLNAYGADCGGLSAPLEELKYLDVDELQMKVCAVPKIRAIYLKMLDIDNMSACGKVENLATKVLKREYGEEPLTAEQCKEQYPELVD